jgi:hypothetical protein
MGSIPIIHEKTSFMNLYVKLNKSRIEKEYRDVQGAWVTMFFVIPMILIGIMILAPDFPVIVPIFGGVISVVGSRKSWKALKALKPLRGLPEVISGHEILNLLRNAQIGYEVTSTKDEERPQSIRFYEWVMVVDEEGISRAEMKTLSSYAMNYTMIFSIKGILPFIDENKVPENYRGLFKVLKYVE